jgi:hypothetical protein
VSGLHVDYRVIHRHAFMSFRNRAARTEATAVLVDEIDKGDLRGWAN